MSYLALAKKIQAKLKVRADTKAERSSIEQIIDERTVAVLIDSTVLGAPIWLAFRDGWRPEEAESIPVFYVSELPALRHKTSEQLRSIFNVKRAFGGGMVKQ
jgi:hypothetical protein